MDAETFEREREALVGRLTELAQADARIAALWLQGSLADGTADALSDVDAFLTAEDEQAAALYAGRMELVDRLGTVLTAADGLLPGLQALHCVLAGPVKLDLFFEPLSRVGERARPAVRLLVDKAGVGPRLRTDWQPDRDAARRRMDAVFRGTRQGATWPVRLLLRGEWSAFAMSELELVNDYLATLLAVQVNPALLFKNRLTLARHLRPEQRALLDEFTDALLAALATRDPAALRDVHLAIDTALVREGRAAYAAVGLPYPGSETGDAALHRFYANEWPLRSPPAGA